VSSGGWSGRGSRTSRHGLVSDVFSERVLADLPGDVAIGAHTLLDGRIVGPRQRAADSRRVPRGRLPSPTNGNLTNAGLAARDLIRRPKGSIFRSSSDSEVLDPTLNRRSEARKPGRQLLDALERVEGAYSLVVHDRPDALCHRRSARLRAPLPPASLAEAGGGLYVACRSETCALDLIGATPVSELEPGEFPADQGSPPRSTKLPSLPAQPHKALHLQLVYFSRPDRHDLWALGRPRAPRPFGRELAREHPRRAPPASSPFPTRPTAMRWLCRAIGPEARARAVRNHYVGRTFINSHAGRAQRQGQNQFNPFERCFRGKKGRRGRRLSGPRTTSRELVQMIRQAGAKRGPISASPQPRSPGVLLRHRYVRPSPELIASSHSLEQIRKHWAWIRWAISRSRQAARRGRRSRRVLPRLFLRGISDRDPDGTQRARHSAPIQVTMAV